MRLRPTWPPPSPRPVGSSVGLASHGSQPGIATLFSIRRIRACGTRVVPTISRHGPMLRSMRCSRQWTGISVTSGGVWHISMVPSRMRSLPGSPLMVSRSVRPRSRWRWQAILPTAARQIQGGRCGAEYPMQDEGLVLGLGSGAELRRAICPRFLLFCYV